MKSLAVLVLLAAFVGNGSALMCRNCVSRNSFEACELMGDVQQCNATIVNANHAIHNPNNPTLLPGNATEFKCYRIQVAALFPNGTDSGTRGYARGCTFNSTNFCSGWVSGLNVTSCGTCTTDNCDQNPVAPTAAPVTTTLVPGASTTTVSPGAATTTTKKPTTGGTSVLQTGMATLTFTSILVLVLAGQ